MENNIFYLQKSPNLEKNKIIRQYVSLDKFFLNFIKQETWIRRKCDFVDKNERIPKGMLFYPTIATKKLDAETKKLVHKNYEKCKEIQTMSNYFVSCWTKEEKENALMWKSYTNGGIGICIISSISNFIASLDHAKMQEYEVYCGEMVYSNLDYTKEAEEFLFWKSKCYSDERELRFVFIPNDMGELNKPNIVIPCNYKVMIDEIRISPYIKKELANLLIEILSNKYDVTARYSSLNIS